MSSCVFAKDIHEIDRALTELYERERLTEQDEHRVTLHFVYTSRGQNHHPHLSMENVPMLLAIGVKTSYPRLLKEERSDTLFTISVLNIPRCS